MWSDIMLEKLVRPSRPGGGLNESYNQISQDAFNRGILGAKAQYAPYTEYANALSKEAYSKFLPYQIQAQILSNPLVWQAFKDKPDELNAMLKNFNSSIPNPNMSRIPVPGQQKGNSLLGIIGAGLHRLGLGGGSSAPQVQQQQGSSGGNTQYQPPTTPPSPSVPTNAATPNELQQIYNENAKRTKGDAGKVPGATIPPYRASDDTYQTPTPEQLTGRLVPEEGMQGAADKMTAAYNENPYKPNTIVKHKGVAITTPGPELIASSQNLDIALKNITPVLNDIAKGAEKWTAPGMAGKLKVAQKLNEFRQNFGDLGGYIPNLLKKNGLTTKDLTDYADWDANQEKAVDNLMTIYKIPQNEMSMQTVKNIIKPTPGEGKEYKNRVLKELSQLKQRADVLRKAVSEGTELFPKNNATSPQNDNVITYNGVNYIKEGNKWRILQ